MRRITITVSADLLKMADHLAARLGRSRSRLFAEALRARVQGKPIVGARPPEPRAVAEPAPARYATGVTGALEDVTDGELLEELERRLQAPVGGAARSGTGVVALSFDRERLADICHRHHIRRVSLFGSVLREDFGPHSDVDVLVEFAPGKTPGLAIVDLEEELAALFGRRVDLATPQSLHRLIRDDVLASAALQYAA